ncbi:uncharacterized protein LOC100679190 isoform X2 [Nasonia vitripennis]|uniref:Uncharacterized protein n=1 Tax=Nasonia vitripennis TaxID=7425 RepID=A0A7M7QRL4_NASVI|nr:uncharacterized protein LOC100679190 isoform X2 [Nasonia vitripennis]XP_016838403.1 uncharacterized protein LOC100679190 isoform X2 [Nasonia vitripennis]XP_032453745.1 uncharacterized protein LOC100679190 isoform X2 [Nasonia vitripennis]
MRKLQGDDDDCCRYREKLAAEKRRANRASRNARKNVTVYYCSGMRDVGAGHAQSRLSGCCRAGKICKRIKKPEKMSSGLDQALTRMKPSFDERSKYANVKHILCILDTEEAVRLKKVKELREAMEKKENCDEPDSESEVRKKAAIGNSEADKKGGGSNSDNVKGKGAQGKDEDTVGGKKSKPVLRDRNRDGKTQRKTNMVKDEFASAEGERECNSICSIDSEVDVGGLVRSVVYIDLTKFSSIKTGDGFPEKVVALHELALGKLFVHNFND